MNARVYRDSNALLLVYEKIKRMMKATLEIQRKDFLLLLVVIFCITTPHKSQAQLLEVDGNSTISGNLSLSHMNDNTTINIGPNAGVNTDFSTPRSNTFVGSNTGFLNSTGHNNSFYGSFTGTLNTSGSCNSFFGYNCGSFNSTGFSNTAMGCRALFLNTQASNLVAIGDSALYHNNGISNSAFGSKALYSNLGGSQNTATGTFALKHNTGGDQNTANGFEALRDNRTGAWNTAVGFAALQHNSTGYENTAFGWQASLANKEGNYNTALGGLSGYGTDNLDNTTCIGYASGGISNVSNRIEIGNSSVSWIGGQVGWSTYSDARIKREVKENVPGLDFIQRLRPVTYHLDIHKQNQICLQGKKDSGDWRSKYDIEDQWMTGFIAQEVAYASKAIDYDFSGVSKSPDSMGLYSLRYAEFVVPLVKAVQEQQEIIESQQDKINELVTQNLQIGAQLQNIVSLLESLGLSTDNNYLNSLSNRYHLSQDKDCIVSPVER
jgi:hypothetical protein